MKKILVLMLCLLLLAGCDQTDPVESSPVETEITTEQGTESMLQQAEEMQEVNSDEAAMNFMETAGEPSNENKSADDYEEETSTEPVEEEMTQEETEPQFSVTEVEPYTMYSSTSLNVRSTPYVADGNKSFILSTNEEVSVVAEASTGWVKISCDKGTGYCNPKYLIDTQIVIETQAAPETSKPVQQEAAVNTNGLVRGNCTDEQWAAAVDYWSRIPDYWRQSFADNGWTMTVTNDDFWTQYGYPASSPDQRLGGITVYEPKLIYVRADCARLETVLPHEFGHFIDCINGFPSQTSEFNELFNSEKDGFKEYRNYDNHSKTSTYEYFAQIWSQLITDPSSESSAANSFAFVRNYY